MIKYLKRYATVLVSLLTQKINGSHVKGLLVESGNEIFLVEATDMYVGRQLRYSGLYGKEELSRIEVLISENSNVVFVGTHVGALAIPTAKKVSKSYFVEANPSTYKFLKSNILLNELDNVITHNVAIGEAEGEINFVLSKVNSGGSKREPLNKKDMYYYDNPNTVSVPMVTLDKLLNEFSEEIDLVFMDIEGSEYFALKGMQDTLKRTKSLIIEFIPHHLKNVSGVSVETFLQEISPHYAYCYIPSRNRTILKADFLSVLNDMFLNDESDDGIIFTKKEVRFN